MLARQAPVAHDLRAVITAVHIAADLERMGALAVHIAQIARRRHPHPALPPEITPYVAEMSRIAHAMATAISDILLSGDPAQAAQLDDDDDAVDDLHRRLLALLTDEPWPHSTSAAIDIALLARYYERFADHTVLIGRRIIFSATGTPAFSRPAP